jgi:hypothetical protein
MRKGNFGQVSYEMHVQGKHNLDCSMKEIFSVVRMHKHQFSGRKTLINL